jgi:hypothetical protein
MARLERPHVGERLHAPEPLGPTMWVQVGAPRLPLVLRQMPCSRWSGEKCRTRDHRVGVTSLRTTTDMQPSAALR